MTLVLSGEEQRRLLRTLRWVVTATLMEEDGERMLKSIIERLERAPKPPRVNP